MTGTVGLVAADHTWSPSAGITPRGTLLLLPGRGEHGGVYERFGRRLSADGYVVHALATTPHDTPGTVLRAVGLAAGPEPAAPVVLVGADTGALQALRAAAGTPRGPVRIDAVVAAGCAPARPAPLPPGTAPGDWDGELAARTACPTHRQRLDADGEFTRGALSEPVPAALVPAALPATPVLLLHGDADPVTPIAQARWLAGRIDRAELGTVRGGVHDVLNDIAHRTVAAALTQWLERLRADPALPPIITLEKPERNPR